MKLGDYIYDTRRSQGMSRKRMALEAGRSYNTIKRVEESDTLPQMDTLFSISEALNVQIEILSGLNIADRLERYRKVYRKLFNQRKQGDNKVEFHSPIYDIMPTKTGSSGYDNHPMIGSLLSTLREQAKLTPTEVARATGYLLKTIYSLEEGHDTLSLKMIFQFAKLYGCEPENIFEPFLEEKLDNYIRLYNTAFYHYQNQTENKKEKKKVNKRENARTGTAILFLKEKKSRGLSDAKMARLIGCWPIDIDRILRGSFPSYKIIYGFAQAFSISPDVVFEVVISDRMTYFENKHREVMCDYLLRKIDRHTNFAYKFSGLKLSSKAHFPKVSNFILTNFEKSGIISHAEVIRRIGCKRDAYFYAKSGKKSLTPLMIEGLAKVFGKDKYEIFNMVVEERVAVYGNDYRKQWKLYKDTLNETKNPRNSKTDKLLVA